MSTDNLPFLHLFGNWPHIQFYHFYRKMKIGNACKESAFTLLFLDNLKNRRDEEGKHRRIERIFTNPSYTVFPCIV